MFFLIFKECYRVERLHLNDKVRLESTLAIYIVTAWRINRLMRLGCTAPTLDVDPLF